LSSLFPSSSTFAVAHIHVHLFFSTCMIHACFYVHESVVRSEVQSMFTSIESRTKAKKSWFVRVLLPVMTSWWCHTYAVSRSFLREKKYLEYYCYTSFQFNQTRYGSNIFDL
jgi:hypothetical protein